MTTLLYRLPLSRVRISGTYTETHDEVLGDTKAREASASLGVMADPRIQLALAIDKEAFEDSDATFSLTEDGRLTGATTSVTGRGSVVVSTVVGVAATILGVAVRAPTGGAMLMDAQDGKKSSPTPQTPAELVEAAYTRLRPGDAKRRKAAMQTLAALRTARQKALKRLATDDAEQSVLDARQLARLAAAVVAAESDVDRENAVMKAWRDGTISATGIAYTIDITLDELRASDVDVRDEKLYLPRPQKPPVPGLDAAQAKIRDAWDKLGCLVLVKDDPVEVHHAVPVVGTRDAKELYVRLPRPVILQFFERSDDGDSARLIREEPAQVLDSASRELAIAQDEVLFGKQSRGLSFSTDGILTGLSFGSTSAAADMLASAGGVPGQVATALDNVSKISTSLGSLDSAGDEAALQRVKRQVDTKTQELNLAGLERTSKDFAELEWLKQQASLKEQRDKAFPTSPVDDPVASEIADLRQQVQLATLRRILDPES